VSFSWSCGSYPETLDTCVSGTSAPVEKAHVAWASPSSSSSSISAQSSSSVALQALP